jgi:hypothetical protein
MRISFPAVLLGSLLATTVAMADSVPKYDMARTCKLIAAATAGLTLDQSMKNCIKGEKQASAQLQKKWSSYPAANRASCVGQNTIGGAPSYAALQACLQF